MNIVIVGCGKTGFTIAKYLSEENHNIVVIDKKIDLYDSIIESIDVMVLEGNGLSAKVLEEAGVKTTDLIICVTEGDETNVLCCLTAKRLGVKRAIARVRDPEYALDLSRFKAHLGVDMIINPEQLAAFEISRLIRFPTADDIETFVGGRVELVSFRINPEHNLAGKSVSHIFQKLNMEVLIGVVERKNEADIPKGDYVLQNDDIVRLLGRPAAIMSFFQSIGIQTERVKDVVIIGGGKITYYLLEYLAKLAIKIKIVEIAEETCLDLSEAFPRCTIIHGDGTDEEILTSENVSKSDAVVALTDRDEENVIIALYMAQYRVPKTIVKINHININIVKNLDIGSFICPKNITAYQIIRYVRGLNNSSSSSSIHTMSRIVSADKNNEDSNSIEALEFNVTSLSKCINIELKDLKIRKNVLIGCIVRSGNIIIPTGTSSIHNEDTVIVLVKNETIDELDDILLN